MRSALANRPIGLLQGGGLSSLAVGVWFAEQHVSAHHYIADIGQIARTDIDATADSLRGWGADVTVVDLRAQMAEMAADLLRYQARHDGGYWNTTGASRFVLVNEFAPILVADGCKTLAHGCVGAGNDERRFARYTPTRAPGLAVYSPWADPAALERFPDRQAMLKAVQEHQIRLDPGSGDERSTDANLAGTSHESAELEDLTTPVTRVNPRWSRWPVDAPTESETITVTFEAGRIVDVDGSGPEPLAWMSRCNEVGARNGVWLRDVVERKIVGTVCRGIYEAPGLELVSHAWERILQASLDGDRRALYAQLSAVTGAAMYEGRWMDVVALAAREAIDRIVSDVSGQVTVVARQGVATAGAMQVSSNVFQQTRFGNGGNRWSQGF